MTNIYRINLPLAFDECYPSLVKYMFVYRGDVINCIVIKICSYCQSQRVTIQSNKQLSRIKPLIQGCSANLNGILSALLYFCISIEITQRACFPLYSVRVNKNNEKYSPIIFVEFLE